MKVYQGFTKKISAIKTFIPIFYAVMTALTISYDFGVCLSQKTGASKI